MDVVGRSAHMHPSTGIYFYPDLCSANTDSVVFVLLKGFIAMPF